MTADVGEAEDDARAVGRERRIPRGRPRFAWLEDDVFFLLCVLDHQHHLRRRR